MPMTPVPMPTDPTGAAFNTAGDAIAQGKTIQAVQTPFTTAVSVQIPRDLLKVRERCLQEARMAGESIFYGWGSGKNRVEGPSVDCAMIILRNFGNCAAFPQRTVVETPTAYIYSAAFVDIEHGTTLVREFKQSKRSKVDGKMDEERKGDIRFQIGASKALRNVILQATPSYIADQMLDEAKKNVRESIQVRINKIGLEETVEGVIEKLTGLGVTHERAEAKFGLPASEWRSRIWSWRQEISARSKRVSKCTRRSTRGRRKSRMFPRRNPATPTPTRASTTHRSRPPGRSDPRRTHRLRRRRRVPGALDRGGRPVVNHRGIARAPYQGGLDGRNQEDRCTGAA